MTVYCFDGTGNHRHSLRPDGRVHRVDAGLGTNVAKLSAILDAPVVYRGGIGNPIDHPYWSQASELAYAVGCKDCVDQIWPTVEQTWSEGDRIIDIIGFGRGAAQAIELINRLADANRADGGSRRVRFCGLFEMIWAAGLPGQRREQIIRHELPGNLRIEHFAECLSWDEGRLQYQCHWQQLERQELDLGAGVQEIRRGVHGDIGGGYATTGLSDGALLWMIEQAGRAGLGCQTEDAWAICGEPLRLCPDDNQLPHRVTDPDFFPKPPRLPRHLFDRARAIGYPLGAWHRVILRNRGQRQKYLMNLDPFIEDRPRSPGYRVVKPRDWFPRRPRPDALMRIDRPLREDEIIELMIGDEDGEA